LAGNFHRSDLAARLCVAHRRPQALRGRVAIKAASGRTGAQDGPITANSTDSVSTDSTVEARIAEVERWV
jgi:hypothetical protein